MQWMGGGGVLSFIDHEVYKPGSCRNNLVRRNALVHRQEMGRLEFYRYSKTCLKRPLKNRKNKGLKDKW